MTLKNSVASPVSEERFDEPEGNRPPYSFSVWRNPVFQTLYKALDMSRALGFSKAFTVSELAVKTPVGFATQDSGLIGLVGRLEGQTVHKVD